MGQPWRDDPLLQGCFHPNYPDDLQVIVHEGGPRLAATPPELMWVRIEGVHPTEPHDEPASEHDGAPPRTVYRGTLLNTPHRLPTLTKGATILLMAVKGSPHPIRTTERYLGERPEYEVIACEKCGLNELFDPPSALVAKVFPDLPEGTVLERFTSFCPLCRGAQQVVAKNARSSVPEPESDPARTQPPRRWWAR
jgi:hypothetical protein